MFYYKFEYNDSCNCHPEWHTEEVEAETLEELGRQIALAMTYCGQAGMIQQVDTTEIYDRRPLTEHERDAVSRALMNSAAPALEALRKKRESEKRAAGRAKAEAGIKKAEAELAKLDGELTPEARAARRKAISEMRALLEMLRD